MAVTHQIKPHKFTFLDKDFVPSSEAVIPVTTHAFLYGTAVFEGIRAYWNPEHGKSYAIFVREHLKRLQQSCKILLLQPYYNLDEMTDKVVELLQKNEVENDVYIRPSWFKAAQRIGPSVYNPGEESEDKFVITTFDLGDYLDTEKGLSVNVSSWRRLSDNAIPPRAKINGSYVNTGLAKAEAVMSGFDDSIFLTEEGHVSEGSAMNLFLLRNGKLVTSGISENILEGITRNFLIELAKNELGLEVECRVIDRTELYVADEAFYAGTGAQIAPITSIDRRTLGDGQVGEITRKLQQLYVKICKGEVEKYHHILTPIEYKKVSA